SRRGGTTVALTVTGSGRSTTTTTTPGSGSGSTAASPPSSPSKQILMGLESLGMTEEIANSILNWMDPSGNVRSPGADASYYSSLNPPYRMKNGPLDSLEELLLVKGVTPQLLFGNDKNRNGVLDPDEDDGSGQCNIGWSAYLTVYSREVNVDSEGNLRINVND